MRWIRKNKFQWNRWKELFNGLFVSFRFLSSNEMYFVFKLYYESFVNQWKEIRYSLLYVNFIGETFDCSLSFGLSSTFNVRFWCSRSKSSYSSYQSSLFSPSLFVFSCLSSLNLVYAKERSEILWFERRYCLDYGTIQVRSIHLFRFYDFCLSSDYVNQNLAESKNLEKDWTLNVLPVNLFSFSLSYQNKVFELQRKLSNESC